MSTIPMICVHDVEKTSKVLQSLFHWKSAHGGVEFDDLVNQEGKSVLWLHDMNEEDHQRFAGSATKERGVGSTIYVLVEDVAKVYEDCQRSKLEIVETLFFNDNAQFREFTFKIKEGYQFTAFERGPYLNL